MGFFKLLFVNKAFMKQMFEAWIIFGPLQPTRNLYVEQYTRCMIVNEDPKHRAAEKHIFFKLLWSFETTVKQGQEALFVFKKHNLQKYLASVFRCFELYETLHFRQ